MLIEDNFIKIRSELILRLRRMDVQKDSNFESLAIQTFRFQARRFIKTCFRVANTFG